MIYVPLMVLILFTSIIFIILALNLMSLENILVAFAIINHNQNYTSTQPIVNDNSLKVELFYSGPQPITSIAFLNNADLVALEKNTGKIQRIANGVSLKELLDVNVTTLDERGMLGVAISKNADGGAYVFLYYTESKTPNGEPIGNRLYRYELINNKLVNPKLLLDLPALPGPYHNGGAITIGPDNNIYIPEGDLDNVENKESPNTKAQNIERGEEPNGSGGILRVTKSGQVVGKGILGETYPLDLYYAYGIRNSFGIDFDPISGNLWDTENGPNFGDEINLVEPGFNSGWLQVQGIWEKVKGNIGNVSADPQKNLVDFNGKGKYSTPEFIWKNRYGPTALKFLDSTNLGEEYDNDLFVGDVHRGNIYHFELNKERTELSLDDLLQDKIADNDNELKGKIFAKGFYGGISDLEVGPDGYLYVVSGIWNNVGKIYRIVPQNN
jgi:glucose/arabinose dehydrogenase